MNGEKRGNESTYMNVGKKRKGGRNFRKEGRNKR